MNPFWAMTHTQQSGFGLKKSSLCSPTGGTQPVFRRRHAPAGGGIFTSTAHRGASEAPEGLQTWARLVMDIGSGISVIIIRYIYLYIYIYICVCVCVNLYVYSYLDS